jgi:hypothetical protein
MIIAQVAAMHQLDRFRLAQDGEDRWNGVDDALVMIAPDASRGSIAQRFPGVYDDPQEFALQVKRVSLLRWATMLLRNRIMSIRMNRQVRRLRNGAGT